MVSQAIWAQARDTDPNAENMKIINNPEKTSGPDKKTRLSKPVMADIIIMGLNHKTADVALRECLGFSRDETEDALKIFKGSDSINELIILSTCNRMEIIMAAINGDAAVEDAKLFLARTKGLDPSEFEKSLYIFRGNDAVRHIFRVASSLDSMVVGEPQILGQIKDAYKTAAIQRSAGVILNRLLHKTFFVAKRVRTETGIGDNAVSISYAAIELGRKIFGALEDKKVLLIGAGEMAELAVEHLIRHRAKDIFVANRTFERALELATRFRGKALKFDEIKEVLKKVDIIISSTGSKDFILKKSQVKKILRPRKNRPLFFIDIAVPRDIDPEINRLANVYVYDIDDLKDVIEENVKDRERESLKAGRIIDEAVIKFRKWHENLDVVPTIVALRNKIRKIAGKEIKKTLAHSLTHLSDMDKEAITRMTDAMIKKILHDPTIFLKSERCFGNKSFYLDATRKLFRLDEEE